MGGLWRGGRVREGGERREGGEVGGGVGGRADMQNQGVDTLW